MASKRKLEDPVHSTSAEDEPPKKIADLKKDVSETDDTDGPNTTTSELVSNIMRKLNEKYNQQPQEKDEVDEASEGNDGVDGPSEGKDGVDGPSEGKDGVDGPSEGTDEVDGSLPHYNLEKLYPPAVFIFNNFKNREGSRKDVQSLYDLFGKVLGFEVVYPDGCGDLRVWADLTGDAFKELIKRIANAPFHTRFGGLVIVVMTHGEENGNLLFHRDDRYPYESRVNIERDLIAPFCGRNQLVGKPKVFILPPCRGTRHNAGVGKDEPDGPGNKLPNNADILVAYSTSEGQVAIRENENGSWYIQEFVEVVKKYHKKNHLVELLTEVHSRVAQQTSQDGVTKNMPEFTSTLRRKLHLVYK